MKKERIWEVDALRGFLILCMIAVHFVIGSRFIVKWYALPAWLEVFMSRAGVLFVLLSGLSATLGTRSFRRGLTVFCCALGLEIGSYLAVLFGVFDDSMVIRFGVLHLLGVSMMLWPLLKNSKPWVLTVLGVVIIALGYWFETFYVEPKFLYALGLQARSFASGDYYPIFPQLGWFLLGGALGKRLYPEKKSLLPQVRCDRAGWRFLRFCGRNSLVIYLIHFLPVGAVLMLLSLLFG